MGLVLEEADESLFWLPQLRGAPLTDLGELDWLVDEAHQLTRIFAASRRTLRARPKADSMTK